MTVLVRADGDDTLGLGHMYRTRRVADHLQDAGIDAAWLSRKTPEVEGFVDGGQTVHWIEDGEDEFARLETVARDLSCKAILWDRGATSPEEGKRLTALERPVVSLDDTGGGRLSHTAVVDTHEPDPDPARLREAGTVYFEGPKWAALNPGIHDHLPTRYDIPPKASDVVVSLGGVDPENVGPVAASISTDLGLETTLVLGPSARPVGGDPDYQVVRDPPDLMGRLAAADAVIVSGALTLFESFALGLPVGIISQSDHQRSLAEAYSTERACIDLGTAASFREDPPISRLKNLFCNPGIRDELCESVRDLTDGLGAKRIAGLLVHLTQGNPASTYNPDSVGQGAETIPEGTR